MRGSCLCGGVRHEITGRLTGVLNCHCTTCRKAHGAAFRTRASVRKADFRWISGREIPTSYASSPGNHRGFCRVCGSPILSEFDDHPEHYGLPLGPLDDEPGMRPRENIFVADKAPCSTSPTACRNIPAFRSAPNDARSRHIAARV